MSTSELQDARVSLETFWGSTVTELREQLLEAGHPIDFVTHAFGATELSRRRGSAGGLHAEVKIGDSIVMIAGGAGDGAWQG